MKTLAYFKRKFLNVFTNNENKIVRLVLFNDTEKENIEK